MDELLTPEEVAEQFKVNRVTIRRWCAAGKIPAIKIGKIYRIKKQDIEDLLVKKRIQKKLSKPQEAKPSALTRLFGR